MDTEIASKRPDLPELESVEAKTSLPIIILPIMYVSFVEWIMYLAYSRLGKFLINDAIAQKFLLISLPLLVIINIWILRRLLFDEYYWKSDAHGLTAQSILRKRFIPWADVVSVISNVRELRLVTTHKKYTIGPMRDYNGFYLACSIWQHLRRHWKADDSDLPEGADFFWDNIPDTLPRNMEWINPKHAKIGLNVLVSLVITIGFSVPFYYISSSKGSEAFILPVSMGLSIGIICGCIIWHQIITVRRLILNGDHFEAIRVYDTIKASFSDVTKMVYEKPRLVLCIRRRKLVIPFNSTDENSQKLILAIIRVLREQNRLLPIPTPDELRKPRKMSTIPVWESLELGLSRSECSVFAGFFSFAGFGVLLKWIRDITYWDVCLSFALFMLSILVYRAAKTYQITINSEKLVKSFLRWSRTVYWSDVEEYEIVAPKEGYSRQRLLKDSKGNIILNAEFGVGDWADRITFFKHLDSILADKIKGYDDKREWLAQPWEPGS